MKIVLDTNIWISGLLIPNSTAGQVLEAWKKAHFSLVTSPFILEEIAQVLRRPKIQKRICWHDMQIEQFITMIKLSSLFVSTDRSHHNILIRDSKDSPILATLINSNADLLITGDDDLLCLKEHYPIMTLAEFYQLLSYSTQSNQDINIASP